ncbi:MAG: hypothetical protein ACPGLV_13315 [Bacteroidia bacterium]
MAIQFQLVAQDVLGALSIEYNKKSAPIIIDYGSGFHTIFYSESSLQYHRLNYNFTVEQKGEVEFKNIGYKPSFIEISGNRKLINVYYRRLDSAGIWLFSVNTINNTATQKRLTSSLKKNHEIYGSYSIGDTTLIYHSTDSENLNLQVINGNNHLYETEIKLDKKALATWGSFLLKYPQLTKTVIHPLSCEFENKQHLGQIKHYFNFRKIKVTIDYGFSTTVLEFDRKIKKWTQNTFNFNIEKLGAPSGGIYGSILKGRYLYQSALFSNGALIEKSDLRFSKTLYNQYIPYEFSKGTGSPVYYLNRRVNGTFKNNNAINIELHPNHQDRLLGININSKGPLENIVLAEVEPIKVFDSWLTNSTKASPNINRRRKQGVLTFSAVQSSSATHFAFLQHIQCMSTAFCFSITSGGNKSPYLGDDYWPMANATTLYHKFYTSPSPALLPTFAKINGDNIFCFYTKKDRKFIFAKY